MTVTWEIIGVGAANLAAIAAAWASNRSTMTELMRRFDSMEKKIGNGGSPGNFVPRETCALVESAVRDRMNRMDAEITTLKAER